MTQPFESWIDRQIREARERGAFDNLPGTGKPLDLGDPNDPDWWVKRKLAKEDLGAALPTPLSLRRQKQDIQTTLADVRREADARAIVEDLNARITESNTNQVHKVPIWTGLLDVESTLAEWRARREGRTTG